MKGLLKITIPLAVLICLLIGVAKTGLLPEGTPLDYFSPKSSFIRHWDKRLKGCDDLDAASGALRENKEGGSAVRLKDGSWVAVVMEHACCTGAGFNATIYVTSEGESYLDGDSCYCGIIDLDDEIYGHDRDSIEGFLGSVRERGRKLSKL